MLRGLDALTTEESVLNALRLTTTLPIKQIRIGRDSLTNTSRGVCYVEMNNVVDAMFLHNQLLGEPPTIDNKLISVSYYRAPQAMAQTVHSNPANAAAANAALAAAQWSHQGANQPAPAEPAPTGQAPTKYSDEEIERLAEYSAKMYAKTPEEKASYLEYYRNYYKNGGDATAAATQCDSQTKKKDDVVVVEGVEYKKYRKHNKLSYV